MNVTIVRTKIKEFQFTISHALWKFIKPEDTADANARFAIELIVRTIIIRSSARVR